MNDTFERQLDKIMGESKAIISPPPPLSTEEREKSDEMMKRILAVLETIELSTKQNMKSMLNAEHQNCVLMDEFLNSSLLNWTSSSPTVSPVKIAQTKKLRKLSLNQIDSIPNNHNPQKPDNGFSKELDQIRTELGDEKSTNSRLRQQLEKSHQRERQLRSQCEELLQTLDRYKSNRRKNSNKNFTDVNIIP